MSVGAHSGRVSSPWEDAIPPLERLAPRFSVTPTYQDPLHWSSMQSRPFLGIGTRGEVTKKKTMGKVSETKSWGLLAFVKPAVLGSVEDSVCGEKGCGVLQGFSYCAGALACTHTHSHNRTPLGLREGHESGQRASTARPLALAPGAVLTAHTKSSRRLTPTLPRNRRPSVCSRD